MASHADPFAASRRSYKHHAPPVGAAYSRESVSPGDTHPRPWPAMPAPSRLHAASTDTAPPPCRSGVQPRRRRPRRYTSQIMTSHAGPFAALYNDQAIGRGSLDRPAHRCTCLLGGRTILKGFRYVGSTDVFNLLEVGKGSGHLEQAVGGAQREGQAFAGGFQPLLVGCG